MIYNVEMYDQGTYICRAENGQGTPIVDHTMVEVLGKAHTYTHYSSSFTRKLEAGRDVD